jgi:methylenetetrahydrofolate reductase (NADPH)
MDKRGRAMKVARGVPQPDQLRRRLLEFVQRTSTEITAHDDEVVAGLAATLPAGTMVYVAHTPKCSLDDVVRVALELEEAGLRASPHIVARRIAGHAELARAASRLRAGGVEQVLVIAGDADRPAGPFTSSLDLLESGALSQGGFARVGVAGHPEGHPAVDRAQLWAALQAKQAWADRVGISVHIVTQFGFDPGAICDWVRELGRNGIRLPVHVGMAGPTPLPKLIRYALACGVGASVHSAMRNLRAMTGLAGLATTPEEMLVGLVRDCEVGRGAQIVHPHVFAFGGSVATARWLQAIVDGRFDLSDGKLALRPESNTGGIV